MSRQSYLLSTTLSSLLMKCPKPTLRQQDLQLAGFSQPTRGVRQRRSHVHRVAGDVHHLYAHAGEVIPLGEEVLMMMIRMMLMVLVMIDSQQC